MDDGTGMYKGNYLEQLRRNEIQGLQKDGIRVAFRSCVSIPKARPACSTRKDVFTSPHRFAAYNAGKEWQVDFVILCWTKYAHESVSTARPSWAIDCASYDPRLVVSMLAWSSWIWTLVVRDSGSGRRRRVLGRPVSYAGYGWIQPPQLSGILSSIFQGREKRRQGRRFVAASLLSLRESLFLFLVVLGSSGQKEDMRLESNGFPGTELVYCRIARYSSKQQRGLCTPQDRTDPPDSCCLPRPTTHALSASAGAVHSQQVDRF